MPRRHLIQMTEDEVSAFLAEPHKLHVATIGGDGTPHLVPVAYTLLDGNVAFLTDARSRKVMNLRRDPRIACLAEVGELYENRRGVLLTGRAHIVEDPELLRRVGEALHQRYESHLPDTWGADVATLALERPVVILVTAERVVSWDHGKLAGAY